MSDTPQPYEYHYSPSTRDCLLLRSESLAVESEATHRFIEWMEKHRDCIYYPDRNTERLMIELDRRKKIPFYKELLDKHVTVIG